MSRINSTKDLGALVKERRKQRGLTQEELAMYCGTGIRFISDLENGKATIQFEKALNVISMLALDMHIKERT
ncbi:MAG: helix-turn-helix transcriptional regulator [Sphaerochaeta sp.]|jgi:HTH-type transcriptional regulator/antitoxin HipB